MDSGGGAVLVVRLDNERIGAGPGTVIAHVASVAEFNAIARDRDGAVDRRLRLWRGDLPVGTRVESQLICGTGTGITKTYTPPECSICRTRHGLEIIHACE